MELGGIRRTMKLLSKKGLAAMLSLGLMITSAGSLASADTKGASGTLEKPFIRTTM